MSSWSQAPFQESPLTLGLHALDRALMRAVDDGDTAIIKDLLDDGANVLPVQFSHEVMVEVHASAPTGSRVRTGLEGALFRAALHRRDDLVDVLWENRSASFSEMDLLQVLRLAVKLKTPHLLGLLLAHPALPVPMNPVEVIAFRYNPRAVDPGFAGTSADASRIMEHQGHWRWVIEEVLVCRTEDTTLSDDCFGKVASFFQAHGVSSLLISQAPCAGLLSPPDAPAMVSRHVAIALVDTFHAPNGWFGLLAQGAFDLCRDIAPHIDWSLFAPRGQSGWTRVRGEEMCCPLAVACNDGRWKTLMEKLAPLDPALWTPALDAWVVSMPAPLREEALLTLLSSCLHPATWALTKEEVDVVGGRAGYETLAPMVRFALTHLDQERLTGELIARQPSLHSRQGTLPALDCWDGRQVKPEGKDEALRWLVSHMGVDASRPLFDAFPDVLAPVWAARMKGALPSITPALPRTRL
jgi:hypothetical protein